MDDVPGTVAHLELLLGREVLTRNHQRVGRLEECRAEMSGGECVVTAFVLGPVGLLERLGLGVRRLFGRAARGYVARWDQMDLRDPLHPRLTCGVEELEEL